MDRGGRHSTRPPVQDACFDGSEAQQQNRIGHHGVLYSEDQAAPWMLPNGKMTKTLDLGEYLQWKRHLIGPLASVWHQKHSYPMPALPIGRLIHFKTHVKTHVKTYAANSGVLTNTSS
jgi:hypothetical protein